MGKLLLMAGSFFFVGCLSTTLEAQNTAPSVEEYPAPLVRERQRVVIQGVTETWELRWNAPPKPACEPNDVSLTCPCTGFAYGEGGNLRLVRIRDGEEINQLELTHLFADADVNLGKIAILQRWKPNYEKDFEASEKDDFLDMVARRPIVKIMDFKDYDHDGNPSEFYLKTDTLPCGKNVGVVIGVSQSNEQLHIFGTSLKPTQPLVLQKTIWDSMTHAPGSVEVVEWLCGDHGSQEETSVKLQWTSRGIDGFRRTFGCPRYPEQRPLHEEPL